MVAPPRLEYSSDSLALIITGSKTEAEQSPQYTITDASTNASKHRHEVVHLFYLNTHR